MSVGKGGIEFHQPDESCSWKNADVDQPFYFVADAYYGAQKIIAGLLKQNNHLVTREVQCRRVHRLPTSRAAQAKRAQEMRQEAQSEVAAE